MYLASQYKDYELPITIYRGTDCMDRFFDELKRYQKHINDIVKDMIISDKQEVEFNKASHCHICSKELKDDRVRDHDHITGLYRGPAHNKCNLEFNLKHYKIPVVN
ncbi:MAG: endonuclease domain-containing protein [Candidatus Sericytochromatia bacterium]